MQIPSHHDPPPSILNTSPQIAEKGVVVRLHGLGKLADRHTEVGAGTFIDDTHGDALVIGLEKHAIEGTGSQGVDVIVCTKTKPEAFVDKLTELYSLAAVAMPYPWLHSSQRAA